MFVRALILLLFSSYSFSNEQALIVYTEEFPPYNFSIEGRVTGINIELVRIACKEAKIECVFQILPWKRAMRYALAGPNTAIVSTARTAEREDKFKWVGPFKSGQNCIYKLASRTDIDIPTLDSAKNYVMGASKDSAYAEVLAKLGFVEGQNLNLYEGKYSKMKPFAAQRIDIIISSAGGVQDNFKHGGLTLSDLAPVAMIDSTLLPGNYLAVHPAISDEVVQRLQAALQSMNVSGLADEVELGFVQPISHIASEAIDRVLWNACVKEESKRQSN